VQLKSKLRIRNIFQSGTGRPVTGIILPPIETKLQACVVPVLEMLRGRVKRYIGLIISIRASCGGGANFFQPDGGDNLVV
jgi:hypothetical protein